MKTLKLSTAAALALALAALSVVPANAQLFIPIGPPVLTPQPDLPQPDTVVKTPERFVYSGSSSQANGAVKSDACMMGVIGQPGVQVRMPNVDANCTALSIVDSNNGETIPAKTIRTPNAPLPQPPLCSQPGFSIPGGFGSRPC